MPPPKNEPTPPPLAPDAVNDLLGVLLVGDAARFDAAIAAEGARLRRRAAASGIPSASARDALDLDLTLLEALARTAVEVLAGVGRPARARLSGGAMAREVARGRALRASCEQARAAARSARAAARASHRH
jgi:hypothetical protein